MSKCDVCGSPVPATECQKCSETKDAEAIPFHDFLHALILNDILERASVPDSGPLTGIEFIDQVKITNRHIYDLFNPDTPEKGEQHGG